MSKKQIIRLTESDIHRIVKNTVERILTEENEMSFEEFLNQVKQLYTVQDYIDEAEYSFGADISNAPDLMELYDYHMNDFAQNNYGRISTEDLYDKKKLFVIITDYLEGRWFGE